MDGSGDGGFRGGRDGGDGGDEAPPTAVVDCEKSERGLKRKCGDENVNESMLNPAAKVCAPMIEIFLSSQREEEVINLKKYVKNMKPDQNEIYFIATNSLTRARNTPLLQKLAEKDIEVLYLVEPEDEELAIQFIPYVASCNEKNFVLISNEDLGLGDEDEDRDEQMKQEFAGTCDWINKRLGERVSSVQVSNRLTTSPCALVYNSYDSDDFKINPEHPIIRSLNDACKSNPNDEEALRVIDLLYEVAQLCGDDYPENPAELGGKIYEMMSMALLGKWGSSQSPSTSASVPETVEAEVVEPAEATAQK